jgi:hypothetical protein
MPSAQVFSFFRQPASRDWSPQDIAEFYRVESVLIQAGLRVVSARGLTDEGDPWFVFCRVEDDEVIVHFARIDGSYVVSAPAYCGNVVGRDFRSLVRGLIENHPILQLRPRGDNLYLHPSALLVVLVATALFKLTPATAAVPAAQDGADTTVVRLRSGGASLMPSTALTVLSDAEQGTLILAAINGALSLTVAAGPEVSAGFIASHALEAAEQPHAMLVDISALEMSHGVVPVGTGSVTPVALQHESVAIVVPADQSGQTLISATLPADAAVVAGPAGSPLPPPAIVAVDPEAAVTYVSLSGISSISAADKALLQTLGLTGNVTYLNDLPSVFSQAVKVGTHAEVHAAAADTSHAATETPADTVSTPPAAEVTASAASVSAAAPVPSVAPTSSASPSEAAPHATSATATAAVPDLSAVIAAVERFQSVEVHPVVLLTPHAAIFYDAAAIETNPQSVHSVTYDFGDGFSISLVGLPAELAYAAVHA